eukprot:3245480-Rhodomonas_salina.1
MRTAARLLRILEHLVPEDSNRSEAYKCLRKFTVSRAGGPFRSRNELIQDLIELVTQIRLDDLALRHLRASGATASVVLAQHARVHSSSSHSHSQIAAQTAIKDTFKTAPSSQHARALPGMGPSQHALPAAGPSLLGSELRDPKAMVSSSNLVVSKENFREARETHLSGIAMIWRQMLDQSYAGTGALGFGVAPGAGGPTAEFAASSSTGRRDAVDGPPVPAPRPHNRPTPTFSTGQGQAQTQYVEALFAQTNQVPLRTLSTLDPSFESAASFFPSPLQQLQGAGSSSLSGTIAALERSILERKMQIDQIKDQDAAHKREHDIEQLRQQNQQLSSRLSASEAELRSTKEQLRALESQSQCIQTDAEEYLQHLEADIAKYRRDLERSEAQRHIGEEQIKKERQQWQQQRAAWEQEVGALKHQVAELTAGQSSSQYQLGGSAANRSRSGEGSGRSSGSKESRNVRATRAGKDAKPEDAKPQERKNISTTPHSPGIIHSPAEKKPHEPVQSACAGAGGKDKGSRSGGGAAAGRGAGSSTGSSEEEEEEEED